MTKDIYTLGISESHNATAALVKNGKLLAAVSEERLSRKKTHMGFPKRAIKEVLSLGGISIKKVDLLVSSFTTNAMYSLYTKDEPSENRLSGSARALQYVLGKFSPFVDKTLYQVPSLRKARSSLFPHYNNVLNARFREARLSYIENQLGFDRTKIDFSPHHLCHVYSAYALRTIKDDRPLLCLTLDGEGDTYCATVGTLEEGEYTVLAATPNFRSIGKLYLAMTAYLGMKPNEHEYKVMGMAPYAEDKWAEKVCDKLKPLMWVDNDLVFQSAMDDRLFYHFIKDNFEGVRFDYLAGGLQLFTEQLILEWVQKAISKTGISDILLGGGVFMNVKANQLIATLPDVTGLSVCPSCGDESTAIGAAFCGYEKVQQGTSNVSLQVDPVGPVYLGREYSTKDFLAALKKRSKKFKYKVTEPANMPKKIASLINKDQIVAVMAGRMEFGARALGARSILADPRNRAIVAVLNQTIKFRDFWMPFASSIIEEAQDDLLINPNRVYSPYMMIAFDVTETGKVDLGAALHPADFTTRPQIVRKDWNKFYWGIINEFRKLTGVGAVLNTSFNLHGEPIVESPEDAFHTLENSDLKWLATENLLIEKVS